MKDINEEEPPPRVGAARPSTELLIEMQRRREVHGVEKYGVRHQWDNGRDHFTDLLQEILDAGVYAAAEHAKREALNLILEAWAARIARTSESVSDEFQLFSKGEVKEFIRLYRGESK